MQSQPYKNQRNNRYNNNHRRDNRNNNHRNNRHNHHNSYPHDNNRNGYHPNHRYRGRKRQPYKLKRTVFLNIVALSCLLLSLQFSWIIWLIWVCCINVIAFTDTIIDKNIAQLPEDLPFEERVRIPEHRFCTQALLSGWIGLIIAQQLYRHKTRKTSFKVKMYFCILVNIILYTIFIYMFYTLK